MLRVSINYEIFVRLAPSKPGPGKFVIWSVNVRVGLVLTQLLTLMVKLGLELTQTLTLDFNCKDSSDVYDISSLVIQ